MAEIDRPVRRSQAHKWSSISSKTGDGKTVTLTAQEHAYLFSMASFASAFPNFLVEFEDEEEDTVQAFLDGVTAKLA